MRYRSDSAGYQTRLLRYLAEGQDARFGVIEFAISCPVYRNFKEAVEAVCEKDWRPLGNGQEWAEVVYAPQSLSLDKKSPTSPTRGQKNSTLQGLFVKTVLSLSHQTISHHLRDAKTIMPYRRPKIEVKTTDKMQDITPFAGLFPVIKLWNRLHLDEVISISI